MKNVLVISIGIKTGESLLDQLESMLGDYIDFQLVTIDRVGIVLSQGVFDLLIFSHLITMKRFQEDRNLDLPFIVLRRVIDHRDLLRIVSLKKNSEVLLVNDTEDNAVEVINQLIEIGLDHINYTPYYPGSQRKVFSRNTVAITPGETQLVPDSILNVINIGARRISIGSLYEIAGMLEMSFAVPENLTNNYITDIAHEMKKIEVSRLKLYESENYLSRILDSLDSGVIVFNEESVIGKVNNRATRILSLKTQDLLGNPVHDFFDLTDYPYESDDGSLKVIYGNTYRCHINRFSMGDEVFHLMVLTDFTLNHKEGKRDYFASKEVHSSMLRQGALHTFSDFLTGDEKTGLMLKKAADFARSDAQILIEGENGTGKEILAQAIHRESKRRNGVFLPVNITAISDTLLESELFGYEPGAFTGADKYGKTGIFEQAEGGSVFIDEIGDAPLSIQVRLLRVIQEKKIRRVGGIHEIPVDVRIITATNKNLIKMVDSGTFRQDLYFRLNVLPIRMIPLRDRRGDVDFLLERFLQNVEEKFMTSSLDFLREYEWPGNVRELLNLCEYVKVIYSGTKLSIDELPFYMQEKHRDAHIKSERHLNYSEYRILQILISNGCKGRRYISQEMNEYGDNITEGKVRSCLHNLEKQGYVSTSGNKGVAISESGREIYSEYKQLNMWG